MGNDFQELSTYIQATFALPELTQTIKSQINTFLNKNPDWDYKGIKDALWYFFEVRGGRKSYGFASIGIVPYVYEEAQAYQRSLQNRKKEISRGVRAQLANKPETITLKERPRAAPQPYDLNLFTDEEAMEQSAK